MDTTPHDESTVTTAHLPQPRGSARWRWSAPGRAAVAGGTMAAVFGLGAGVAGATSSSASSSVSSSGSASGAATAPAGPGQRPSGTRPTVAGRITALSGNAITLRTRDNSTTTVDYSAATTFASLSAKGTTSTTSAAALKVGAFVGVRGAAQSNGTVSASRITVSPGPPGGRGTPPAADGRSAGAPRSAPPGA
jgi:hypothetical protein